MRQVVHTGAAYFGNRTLRHVRTDMEDMARSGFTYVVHCFTENDLRYSLDSMRHIVEISHEVGLEVHLDPWGVAGIFGGEAFSNFAQREVQACQVLADGARVGAGCLNRRELRDFLRTWIDGAAYAGGDVLFWDEPHWYPGDLWFYGEQRGDPAPRWSCHCEVCRELFRERYGRDLPREIDPEVVGFRQASVLEILTDVITYGAEKGPRNALCLLPQGHLGSVLHLPDWELFLQIRGLDIFGTDPYWAARPDQPVPLEPYVRSNARRVRELCDRYGLEDQFWIQGYNFRAGQEEGVAEAVGIAVEEGMTNLAVWSYRACEPMSKLWPENPEKVWRIVTESFQRARGDARGNRAS